MPAATATSEMKKIYGEVMRSNCTVRTNFAASLRKPGATILVYISAPGFLQDAAKLDLTVRLLRLTSPYIFFISLVAVAAGILNTYNKFWVPAFAPILLNLCFIGGALWLAPYCNPPIMALAWAVFVAGIVQLAFQVPFLKQIGMLPSIRFNWHDEGMWRVIKQMGPAVFGVSIGQISLIINTILLYTSPSP